MKAIITTIAIAFAALLLAGVAFAPPGYAADGADAKELFVDTHKCNMCHSVAAAEIEAKTTSDKMKGADLGGKVEGELAEIAAYVRKEAEIDGETHKKEFKGTDEELQAIVDWLGSLEAPE